MRSLIYSDKLVNSSGCFLLPNNMIISNGEFHEATAKSFCSGDTISLYDINLERTKDNIRISNKQLDLLNQYIKYAYKHQMIKDLYSNFLVQVLNFDRIRLSSANCIVTSSDECYSKFYNYYLMEHDIVQMPKLIYHENDFVINSQYNNEVYAEEYKIFNNLEKIKTLVKKDERSGYFKKDGEV